MGLDAFVPVPDHVGVEGVDELVDAVVPVVPVVVELLLQSAEEALGGSVARRAALGAHGTGQPVAFADADPSGPAVVASPVGVDDGMLAVGQGGACLLEHGVGQFGCRAGADAPRHGPAVVAVDDRAEVYLAFANAEFGDVGDPQPVGRFGVEAAFDEVGGRRAVLARIGVAAPAALEPGRDAMRGHELHDASGAHADTPLARHLPYAPVAVAFPALPERVHDWFDQPLASSGPVGSSAVVVERAARKPEPAPQVPRSHGEHAGRMQHQTGLPGVGQVVRVCAPLFSQQLPGA